MRTIPRPRLARVAVAITAAALLGPAAGGAALAHERDGVVQVDPELETPALFEDDAGGNADADDPAIWLHPDDPSDSLVVTVAKEGGLYAYDLDGRTVQHIPAPPPNNPGDVPGRFNNVDLVYGFELGGEEVDLAVVSDRGHDTVRLYVIDPDDRNTPLTEVTDPAAPWVFSSSQDEVNTERAAYGLATWQDGDDAYALVSQNDRTRIALVRLFATDAGTISYERVRTLDLPASFTLPDGTTWRPCSEPGEGPQAEGMVVDSARDTLYVAQEAIGIWRVSADLQSQPVLIDKAREYGIPGTYDPATDECVYGEDPGYGGEHLSIDVEGLTIYRSGDRDGYLIASSQGDNTFAVYDRESGNDYLGSFHVASDDGVDSVQESDGAHVLNVALNDEFDNGLFVTQDGVNTPDVGRENTNFKFVEWDNIAESFDHELDIDTDGWNPRDR